MPANRRVTSGSLAKTTRLKVQCDHRSPLRVLPFALKSLLNLKPAVLALLIQGCSLVILLLVWSVVQVRVSVNLNPVIFAFAQGSCALFLTMQANMRSWWRYIQFLFPIIVVAMTYVHIANSVYLVGFVISLMWYWSTFRTQVPFYPSLPKVWRQLALQLPQDRPIKMIDIGSGIGDLVMYMAEQRPESKLTGIEIAPLPWLVSHCRNFLRGAHAQFLLGDYEKLSFAEFDVVFAYLSPAAMPNLWHKAACEMRPGSMLMSYEFDIPNRPASQIISIPHDKRSLYIWRF